MPTYISDSYTSLIDHFWATILDSIQSAELDKDIADPRTIVSTETKNESVFHVAWFNNIISKCSSDIIVQVTRTEGVVECYEKDDLVTLAHNLGIR